MSKIIKMGLLPTLAISALIGVVDPVISGAKDQNVSIDDLKRAISSRDSASLELELGKAYEDQDDLQNAIPCYVKAIGLKPESLDVQVALIRGWNKALLKNPSAPENHIGLGEAYQYHGDLREAYGQYRHALSLAGNTNGPMAQMAHKFLDSRLRKPPIGFPTAAISATKPQGKEADSGGYIADVKSRIKAVWSPPKGHEADLVLTQFKIHKNGEVSDLKLVVTSSFAPSNEAALAALKNASPFKPLPEGAADTVDAQFTFSYSFFAAGRSIVKKHVIWFAGDTDPLFGKILDALKAVDKNAVTADPTPFVLFDIRWHQTHFAVKHAAALGSRGLVITMPDSEVDVRTWETQLSHFYEEIVRPLADKTGGVTCGISQNGDFIE
jgi:TonB family protein